MSTVLGSLLTNFTSGVMLDFEPMIAVLDPFDTPLQNSVDANGLSALTSSPAFEITVKWQDETLLNPRALAGATATTAETVLTITANDGRIRFQTDDILVTPLNEYVRVTGYGSTANTLTISRSYASSTAGTITSGDTLVGVGSAPVEGADPSSARAVDRSERTNYTEIFGPYAVQVSGSANAIRKYGLVGTEFDHQLGNRIKEAGVTFEQTLLYGKGALDTTSSPRRTMDGMIQLISTNVNSTTTSLTETALLNSLQSCFDAGGNPDRIVVGSKQKRTISAFTSFGTIQVMRPDTQRGVVVDTYKSDFGQAVVILDRWCRTQDLFIFNRDQADIAVLRPLTFTPLAKTGDADKGMIVMEKSLRFRRQRHAARFSALT